jgi:hypothetical protein
MAARWQGRSKRHAGVRRVKSEKTSKTSLLAVTLAFGVLGVAATIFTHASNGSIAVGNPYIDPAQLNLISPATSFYYQPWRGYMETVPANKFLEGIGVNYNPVHSTPAQDDANLQYLASIGVHAIRVELPWIAVSPTDETKLTAAQQTKYNAIFAACKKYGITPTILLNANDGGPQPAYPSRTATVVGSPQIGATQITVNGIAASDITVHQPNTATGSSGISLGGLGKAGNLITNMVTNGDGSLTLTLSQPLAALPNAGKVTIDYLKYMPLYPVGSPEFNNTAAGWLQYTKTATNTAQAAGLTKYDVEIWNELSFGSRFIGINNYYKPDKLFPAMPDTLRSGGGSWELANQTTQYLKSTYGNNVGVIWGFSNTTFYHTAITDLPPKTDGESYHPYSTNVTTLSNAIGTKNASFLKEGSYVPNISIGMPEGNIALDFRIEALIRGKLAPAVRDRTPSGTTDFKHYITETGLSPAEDTVSNNQPLAQLLKSKAFLREYSFWLNKGIDQFDVFAVFGNNANDGGFNMLASGSDNSGSPITQQSETLRHFTDKFAGAVTPSTPRSLGVTVNDTTPNDAGSAYQVFPADPTTGEPALHYREMFQFLPFQVTDHKFVIPAYVMSWNLMAPPPPMSFEVNVSNVDGNKATASYYDPITDTSKPIQVVSKSSNTLVLNIEAVDYPRLITIDDTGGSTPPPASKTGDITGAAGSPDGVIDLYDLSYVIRHYNIADATADVTGTAGSKDGKVDLYDMSYIIRNYGK